MPARFMAAIMILMPSALFCLISGSALLGLNALIDGIVTGEELDHLVCDNQQIEQ
jgi:hypothetical protein